MVLRILREFNKATVTARTKHPGTKAAAVPHGIIDGVSNAGVSRRATKHVSRKKKENDKRQRKDSKNDTQRAASSAAETSGRGNAAGGQNIPLRSSQIHQYGWGR
jgi:uncharacterized protein YaiL (DUF2058 family)